MKITPDTLDVVRQSQDHPLLSSVVYTVSASCGIIQDSAGRRAGKDVACHTPTVPIPRSLRLLGSLTHHTWPKASPGQGLVPRLLAQAL